LAGEDAFNDLIFVDDEGAVDEDVGDAFGVLAGVLVGRFVLDGGGVEQVDPAGAVEPGVAHARLAAHVAPLGILGQEHAGRRQGVGARDARQPAGVVLLAIPGAVVWSRGEAPGATVPPGASAQGTVVEPGTTTARSVAATQGATAPPAPPPAPAVVKPVATPTRAAFYSQRADASLAKGEVDAALTDYNKALEIKADDPALYVSRGKALFTKKSFDQSVKDYDKAIELAPKTAVAFLNRGASHEKLGDVQKALADYKSAADLDAALETAKAEVKRIETQLAKEEADRKAKEEADKA